jgi:carboxyl-terminal processing protease
MMLPLRDGGGFWMQFPVTDYVTIKGLRLEGNGLKPDFEEGMPRFGEEDKAISKALALLSEASTAGRPNP